MGKPVGANPRHRLMNQIVSQEGTRGTETSKYPEEKKEKSIPGVAASEKGRGQTGYLRMTGVEGCQRGSRRRDEHRRKAGPKRVTVL